MSFASGDYCPEKVNLHKGPENKFTGKGPSETSNDIPAAGAYSSEKVNSEIGPQYSSTGRGSPDKASDSPGPADYHPENILNLEHKPYVSYGNRKYLHKSTDIPSDGGD